MSLIVLAGLMLGLGDTGLAADPPFRLPPGVTLPAGLSDLQPLEGQGWVVCQAAEIAAFQDRAHVRCANGSGHGTHSQPPAFVAVDIQAEPGLATALLTAGARSRESGSPLYIQIDYAAGANPPGCLPEDCRRATGFVVE